MGKAHSRKTMKIRVSKYIVSRTEDIADGNILDVEILDEGAGEFISLTQFDGVDEQQIRINADEWPAVRTAINHLPRRKRAGR